MLLGRFQRSVDASGFHPGVPRLRRASGGTHLLLGEGDVHLLLALATADALVPCTPASLVNRYVRPVLRGLGGAYFGRDWIAGPRELGRRPIAFAGFAHDAASGRAAMEVLVPARDGWCESSRASHRGLAPAHLGGPARFVDKLVSAFEAAFGASTPFTGDAGGTLALAPRADDVPWAASIDEAMGPLRAGRDAGGVLRLGGEIFASVDRLDALGPAVSADLDRDAVGALVDTAFTRDGGVIVGVGDLANVRDVLLAAR